MYSMGTSSTLGQDGDHKCIRYSTGTNSTLGTVWGQVEHWLQDRDHKCIRYSTIVPVVNKVQYVDQEYIMYSLGTLSI